ncbi:NADH dehydrogenase subunit J [Geoalkalibacter ferrihydriticus]|uniref:NADH-quinone oxidoreductase subunit J n=2 Tax=Geoalkalibacter ferrihydriticus TaxID=392333 RepID=A0A0C2HGS5_9BACT|nr:NADH-quinone oxidoreductase subunit J [Geoalkalibacter ferrihydriticus]KIH76136.1 NADH dehydrogenase [Geoalkalibacter ferrihydriticus DSM 17813]SDM43368.1 NADH dehydrogenase subunit J [Geoalkalibacter ferrihydriticus]
MASIIFYILGFTTLAATAMCITRRNPVHAVVYLVNALFALALMFYLLGAPLVAAWEVIIYAGAIMVLFLFIIMMFELSPDSPETQGPGWRRWGPVVLLSLVILGCTLALLGLEADPQGVPAFWVSPREFGAALFDRYALGVQVISFQLLYAAVGAYYLGKGALRRRSREDAS